MTCWATSPSPPSPSSSFDASNHTQEPVVLRLGASSSSSSATGRSPAAPRAPSSSIASSSRPPSFGESRPQELHLSLRSYPRHSRHQRRPHPPGSQYHPRDRRPITSIASPSTGMQIDSVKEGESIVQPLEGQRRPSLPWSISISTSAREDRPVLPENAPQDRRVYDGRSRLTPSAAHLLLEPS